MAWSRLFENKWSIAGIVIGAAKSLRDNYWLFSLAPLGKEKINPAENFGMIISDVLIYACIVGMIGRVIDNQVKQNSPWDRDVQMTSTYQSLQP